MRRNAGDELRLTVSGLARLHEKRRRPSEILPLVVGMDKWYGTYGSWYGLMTWNLICDVIADLQVNKIRFRAT